jgi:hypothetical protein
MVTKIPFDIKLRSETKEHPQSPRYINVHRKRKAYDFWDLNYVQEKKAKELEVLNL